ncbi:RluA family pseudouridine synthase [Patescibacteria group bacterium]|nr:RluA family pseudouridine synthase [Patescibacteria group bacterium]MBU1722197.1 RluA family pseudouridine synthase [Patescibacteria group bacterium]MBU1901148.1 RluA family pseudouridine synthase [Patescibacteria group bacterium]
MNKLKTTYTVDADHAGKRLDTFLAEVTETSRTAVLRLIKADCVEDETNKILTKGGVMLKEGMKLTVHPLPPEPEEMIEKREDTSIYGDIKILADTADYVVVHKPYGLLVHPSNEMQKVTLVDWAVQQYPEVATVGEDAMRPGIVHRLDRETTGVMVIAKTQAMFDSLKEQFAKREVKKYYYALVHGQVEKEHDIIDFLINRGVSGKMVSRPNLQVERLSDVRKIQKGKKALTEFWVQKRFHHYTLVKVQIHTGRTHQIRVHFFAYNHPVVGDSLYMQQQMKRKDHAPRMCLQACELLFTDLFGEIVHIQVDLDKSISDYVETLTA